MARWTTMLVVRVSSAATSSRTLWCRSSGMLAVSFPILYFLLCLIAKQAYSKENGKAIHDSQQRFGRNQRTTNKALSGCLQRQGHAPQDIFHTGDGYRIAQRHSDKAGPACRTGSICLTGMPSPVANWISFCIPAETSVPHTHSSSQRESSSSPACVPMFRWAGSLSSKNCG